MRAKLAETFAYGTHSFTDAIDADGHGNGPFASAAVPDARDRAGRRGPLHLRRDRDRRPVGRAGEPADESRRAGHGARRSIYLGGDPGQVCNAGGPQALDEVRLREGSLLWPRFPAPLGMRGLTMMRLLAALNGLVNAAGGKAPASHSAYVISLMRGIYRRHGRAGALPAGRRHRRRLRRAALSPTGSTPSISSRRRTTRSSSSSSATRCGCGRYGIVAGQRRRGPLSRRLRHRARVRDPGRGGGAGGPHRQREEPALGHRRRHVRRRRARRRQSRHEPQERVLRAAVGRQHAQARRHPAHRDGRRRRLWPSASTGRPRRC